MLRTVKKLTGLDRKDILAAFVSGLLLSLAYSDGRLWIFTWFGFVPAFLALNNKSLKSSTFLLFITGIFFWWMTVYWLVHVTFIGTAVLVLYLALYFGIFGAFIRPFTRRSGVFTALLVPSAWVLLEYTRSWLLTGFPWALLGYSQYQNLVMIQGADLVGSYGVSFLVMLANAAATEIVYAARERLLRRLVITGSLSVLVFSLVACYGFLRLSSASPKTALLPLRVCVVQGNIPQELKWEPRAQGPIISKYLSLSREALKDAPELIVWPEASFPELLEDKSRSFGKLLAFAADNKTPLLIGAVTVRGGAYYNSALLLSRDGREAARYNKVHLVPFGEYIPLKRLFPFLEVVVPIGDIDRGTDYTVFSLPEKKRFSVLICFEDVFPELSRRFIHEGADFLVNITNDAWYKKTSAAGQHLQASVFRAVENRVYLVRSANTGISGFISPAGRLSLVRDKNKETLFVDGYLTYGIPLARHAGSFYTRYGDLFVFFCAFICLGGALYRFRVLVKRKARDV